jgi:FkbH-like protein
MVFIDDSPAECEFVRDRHPNVSVFLTPSDPLLLREFAHKLRSFDSVDVTGEDLERGRQYLSQSARQSEERRHATLDEFLASLQMRIEITTPTPQDVARVAQLTQKTNQFNLTTRRYTDAAIEHMLTSGEKRVYQARVSDKYGSYGIVSVVIFEIVADQLVLDNILMSCRIIGRKVEAALMAFLVKIARESGVTRIVGERISTAKNAPTVNLFRDFNFELIEATDVHELWSLNVEKSNIALPQLFSVTW